MDRTVFFLVGLSLAGCSTDPQIDLNQELGMITNKSQVIVSRAEKPFEDSMPVDAPLNTNSAQAKDKAEAEYPLYTYKPKPRTSTPSFDEKPMSEEKNMPDEKTMPEEKTMPDEKMVVRKVVSPSLMVAGDEVMVADKPKPKAPMARIPRSPYTIQVVSLKDHRGFQPYVNQLSKDNPMWVYQKRVNGDILFALLYGEYASKEEAMRELKKLPKNFIGYGAFVRAFSAIQKSEFPKLKPVN